MDGIFETARQNLKQKAWVQGYYELMLHSTMIGLSSVTRMNIDKFSPFLMYYGRSHWKNQARSQLHLLQWFWECIWPDSMCTTYRLYCLQLEPEYVICIYISPQHSISKLVSFPGSPLHRRGSLGINEANCKLMIKFMCKPFLQLQCCCKQQQKSYINKTKVPYWIFQYHTSRGTV